MYSNTASPSSAIKVSSKSVSAPSFSAMTPSKSSSSCTNTTTNSAHTVESIDINNKYTPADDGLTSFLQLTDDMFVDANTAAADLFSTLDTKPLALPLPISNDTVSYVTTSPNKSELPSCADKMENQQHHHRPVHTATSPAPLPAHHLYPSSTSHQQENCRLHRSFINNSPNDNDNNDDGDGVDDSNECYEDNEEQANNRHTENTPVGVLDEDLHLFTDMENVHETTKKGVTQQQMSTTQDFIEIEPVDRLTNNDTFIRAGEAFSPSNYHLQHQPFGQHQPFVNPLSETATTNFNLNATTPAEVNPLFSHPFQQNHQTTSLHTYKHQQEPHRHMNSSKASWYSPLYSPSKLARSSVTHQACHLLHKDSKTSSIDDISSVISKPLHSTYPYNYINTNTNSYHQHQYQQHQNYHQHQHFIIPSTSSLLPSHTKKTTPTKSTSDTGITRGTVVKKTTRKPKTYSKPVASRFCHICSRTPRRGQGFAVCKRISEGLCRKIVCEQCITEHGWDYQSIKANMASWACPHCLERCPARSQCHIYNRINARRKRVGSNNEHQIF